MKTPTILTKIVDKKQEELTELKRKYTVCQMKEEAESVPIPPSFEEAMKKEGLSIIGEIKKASPSKGMIKENFQPKELAETYESIVDAVSVLTEKNFFQGKIEYLSQVKQTISLPLLRKDFIIDPIQIYEAKARGASCLLLITAILDVKKLTEYIQLAEGIGMDALVEVHTLEETETAKKAGAHIIGINNRNLDNFIVDLDTTRILRQSIPEDIVVISESGFHSKEDIIKLQNIHIDGILVGEGFMRTDDMEGLAKEFRHAYKSKN